MSDNFKHNKLINKVSDMFSNKTFDERKDISLFMANQQLITVEQTKHKINQQHKKLLTELQGWEDNISKQITKLLEEKERSVNKDDINNELALTKTLVDLQEQILISAKQNGLSLKEAKQGIRLSYLWGDADSYNKVVGEATLEIESMQEVFYVENDKYKADNINKAIKLIEDTYKGIKEGKEGKK